MGRPPPPDSIPEPLPWPQGARRSAPLGPPPAAANAALWASLDRLRRCSIHAPPPRPPTPLEAAAIRFLLVAQLMFVRFHVEPADITVTVGEGETELERINLAQAIKDLEELLPLAPLSAFGVIDVYV